MPRFLLVLVLTAISAVLSISVNTFDAYFLPGAYQLILTLLNVVSIIVGISVGLTLSLAVTKIGSPFPWLGFMAYVLIFLLIPRHHSTFITISTVGYLSLLAAIWVGYYFFYNRGSYFLADLNLTMAAKDYFKTYKRPDSRAELLKIYERRLASARLPLESRYIHTRFGPTHVLVGGPLGAPPLILISGLNDTALGLLNIMAYLTDHYRVYAPDTIGTAGRSSPIRPDPKGFGYGEWLFDVMNGLELRQASFAAEGTGGWILFKFAQVAPYMIQRAVLVTPLQMAQTNFPPLKTFLAVQWMNIKTDRSTVRAYLQSLMLPGDQVSDAVVENLLNTWNIFKHQIYTLIPPVLTPQEISHLNAPTLLLLGRDILVKDTQAVSQIAHRYMPQVQIHLVRGSSPAFSETQVEAAGSAIARFLMVESPALG